MKSLVKSKLILKKIMVLLIYMKLKCNFGKWVEMWKTLLPGTRGATITLYSNVLNK